MPREPHASSCNSGSISASRSSQQRAQQCGCEKFSITPLSLPHPLSPSLSLSPPPLFDAPSPPGLPALLVAIYSLSTVLGSIPEERNTPSAEMSKSHVNLPTSEEHEFEGLWGLLFSMSCALQSFTSSLWCF